MNQSSQHGFLPESAVDTSPTPPGFSASDEVYCFTLSLPDYEEKDLEVRIFDKSLIVSGTRYKQTDDNAEGWYSRHRETHCFTEAFRLPNDATRKGLSFDLSAGELTVWIARKGG